MDQAYLLEILKKYREGTASPEEQQFLLQCYDAFDAQPEVTTMLTDGEREQLKHSIRAGILLPHITPAPIVHRRGISWFRAAAAVLLLVGAATVTFLLLRTKSSAPATIASQTVVQPEKENNLIALPDGSSVLVSAGSSLQYPPSFEGKSRREVYLQGKALFTIEQRQSQPFVVHAGGLQTTVLGTTFEVAAQTGEVKVTVTRGRVRVDDKSRSLGELSANEQIVYHSGEGEAQHLQLTTAPLPSWQQEDMLFDDVTLKQAAQLLEDRFHVTITIPDEHLRQQRFTTTVMKQESLPQILHSICAFHQANYTLDSIKRSAIIYKP